MALQSLDELERQLHKQIHRFNDRRKATKFWRNFLLNSQIIASALTVITTSINIKYNCNALNITATLFSATAITSSLFQTSYMFHDRLQSFTETSSKLQGVLGRLMLRKLQHIDSPTTCPLDTTTISNFHLEMELILNSSNLQWSEMMKNNKPKAFVDDQLKSANPK